MSLILQQENPKTMIANHCIYQKLTLISYSYSTQDLDKLSVLQPKFDARVSVLTISIVATSSNVKFRSSIRVENCDCRRWSCKKSHNLTFLFFKNISPKVGKTCFCTVFAKKEFPNDYCPTVFETHPIQMKLNGKVVIFT